MLYADGSQGKFILEHEFVSREESEEGREEYEDVR